MADIQKEDLDGIFLNIASTGNQASTCWQTQLSLKDKRITFKIDTRAEATVISEETFKSLGRIKLRRDYVVLPSNPFPVLDSLLAS